MGRLLDEDDVINTLWDLRRNLQLMDNSQRADLIFLAEKRIERLPSAQLDTQWIPCSEKLPKKEELHYWVCTDTGYQCQCRWTNDVYGFGASDRWDWKIFDIPQYQKVVAWMPLPEPYREEVEMDE